VPTPLAEEGSADLSAVQAATADALRHLRPDGLLLLASTCPVGTARGLVVPEGVSVASLPERGLPGRMLAEVIGASRLVGGVGEGATERAVAFVSSWCEGEVLGVSAEEAELAKLVENSWRDLSIAFANEVEGAARGLGLDGARVLRLASTHPRVELAVPGIGVGGHCLPVDPHFLPAEVTLPRVARRINDGRIDDMVARIRAAAPHGGRVGCLGLAYKPGVADVRNAPAVAIVERLLAAGIDVVAHDPYVGEVGVPRCGLEEALGCGFVVRLVDHGAYGDRAVDLDLARLG
jgi:UDP-N-acetyl-D-mannosaminuronic acid dehydrogenase